MPQLNYPEFRRDYKGEPITYVDNGQMKSLFVNPRDFPYDLGGVRGRPEIF